MLTIREAEHWDLLNLLQIGETYFKEDHSWQLCKLDGDWLFANMSHAIQSDDHCIFVAYQDGELVGGFWGTIIQTMWSPELVGKDLFLYVKPERRSFRVASQLLNHFEEWAKAKGAVYGIVGANSGIDENKAATALWKRKGWQECGPTLIKPLGG